MGILCHLFKIRDIDYLEGPVNMLLWGSEFCNLNKMNQDKLRVFQHSEIR